MILQGTPKELEKTIAGMDIMAELALNNSGHIYAQMLRYQGMALYVLAKLFNLECANILEIGTAAGYSTSLIAQAAPLAYIVTLNHRGKECDEARVTLEQWPNIEVVQAVSWEFLDTYTGPKLDMIFVDGNHNRVAKDMPWFNWLNDNGLMLFHDYSVDSSPVVFDTVNLFAAGLGRELDIKIVDSNKIGMAGLFRKDGEKWQT